MKTTIMTDAAASVQLSFIGYHTNCPDLKWQVRGWATLIIKSDIVFDISLTFFEKTL